MMSNTKASPSPPEAHIDKLREEIDDIIGEARNDAYQAGGNDENMDLRDYTGEIMGRVTALLEAIEILLPERDNRKHAEKGVDQGIQIGFNTCLDQVRATLKNIKGDIQ